VLGEYDMTAVLVGRNPDHRYDVISPRSLAA